MTSLYALGMWISSLLGAYSGCYWNVCDIQVERYGWKISHCNTFKSEFIAKHCYASDFRAYILNGGAWPPYSEKISLQKIWKVTSIKVWGKCRILQNHSQGGRGM